jgi:hypothetical protein
MSFDFGLRGAHYRPLLGEERTFPRHPRTPACDPKRRPMSPFDPLLRPWCGGNACSAMTRYEIVVNLKTAKAQGVDVPAKLLAHA